LLYHFITNRGNFCTQIRITNRFISEFGNFIYNPSIIRRKKKSTLGNYIIQLIPQDAREVIMPQCGRSTGKDKGAIPTVLYYSDRRKAVTNELGRPYEHRHISIHYLQRDALLPHALQCTRCTIVEISISVSPTSNSINSIFHSGTVLYLSDSFKIKANLYTRLYSDSLMSG